MALNGIYRFLYYYLMKKIPVKDVPSGLEDDVFDLPGVELGKYALQLPPPVDSKSDGDIHSSNHLNNSQAVITRQSFEMQSFEKEPLMQEMSCRLEGFEVQLNDNNIRTASRFHEIETKIEGILHALKIGLPDDNAARQSIEALTGFKSAPSFTPVTSVIPVNGEMSRLQHTLHHNPPNLPVSGWRSLEPQSNINPAPFLTPATQVIPVYGQAPSMQAQLPNPPNLVAAGLTYESKISSLPSLAVTPAPYEIPVYGEEPRLQNALHYHPPSLAIYGEQTIHSQSGSLGTAASNTHAEHGINADGAAPKARQKSDLPNILLDSIDFACSLSS